MDKDRGEGFEGEAGGIAKRRKGKVDVVGIKASDDATWKLLFLACKRSFIR